jgi:hypothetical protein
MCKETKLGLASGLLMIIIMAIGFRTNESIRDDKTSDVKSEKVVREKQKKDIQFQTTSRSPKSGPTLD